MNVSILYITCNLYSNLWLAYLKLAKKYKRTNIKTYICTDIEIKEDLLKELKKYNVEILIYGKKSNNSSGGNFYKRLLFYLNRIASKNIIYQVDDMLPRNIINENSLNDILELLETNDKIKYIKLSNASERYTGKIVKYKNKIFKVGLKNQSYLWNSPPHIVKKNFFIDYLNWCELNYKKHNITHLNGGLEILGKFYAETQGSDVIFLRAEENLIKYYGEPFGVIRHGIIYNNSDKVLKEKENIDIHLFNNNKTIFQVNENELNLFGKQNANRLKRDLKI